MLSGSPEATPSGKRSRRSRQTRWDFAPKGVLQAAVAPTAAAMARKERRVMVDIVVYPCTFFRRSERPPVIRTS